MSVTLDDVLPFERLRLSYDPVVETFLERLRLSEVSAAALPLGRFRWLISRISAAGVPSEGLS